MKTPAVKIGWIITLLLGVATSMQAEIKNFTFQGTIASVDDEAFVLDGSITNGAPFEGFYIFDSTMPDSNTDATVGDYRFNGSTFGVVVKVGSYVFRTNPRHVDFLIEVVNRPDGDSHLFRSYHNVCSQPLPIGHIAWQLDDSSGSALQSALLPLTPPTLANFGSIFGLTLEGDCSSFFIRGHVTSITEAPAVIPVRPEVEITPAIQVQWPSRLGYFYQVQQSENMQDWVNVGEPVLGDGTTLSRFFARDPGRQLFYRAEIANYPE
jgi:hypothetical protein